MIPLALRRLYYRMGPRSVLRYIIQAVLISVFTTMVLMLFLGQSQDEQAAAERIKYKKSALAEQIRSRRLRAYQKTIFVNPQRPADWTYNINVTLAEKIPLERDIPDSRPKECADVKYDTKSLPTMSVVIPFYNEALSMLLRTVHSILTRTPPELLKDIILVNDHSPNEDLGSPLEQYVKLLPPKVRLVRTQKREGLIRARMIGARLTHGDVLMFQDAHTEANVGWAEPLLVEIKRNPSAVIQPEVDQVEAHTIEYIGSSGIVPRGGFSWDLR